MLKRLAVVAAAVALAAVPARLAGQPGEPRARTSSCFVEFDLHTEKLQLGLDRAVQFDQAIQRAAGRTASDTLILFTADHSYDFRVHAGRKDTALVSGLDLAFGDNEESVRLPHVRREDDHTGEEVLVAAQGPGAARVRGILANSDLFHVMLAAFRWD